MRREVKLPYHSTREIKNIQFNPVISPALFDVPEGVFVEDASNSELISMIDKLKKQMNEMSNGKK